MNWWKKYGDKVGRDGVCSRTTMSNIHKPHLHKYPYMWCLEKLSLIRVGSNVYASVRMRRRHTVVGSCICVCVCVCVYLYVCKSRFSETATN